MQERMKSRLPVCLLILASVLATQELLSQENRQPLSFRLDSPRKQYAIEVNGYYQTECPIVLIGSGNTRTIIATEYMRYEPQIMWISDSIAKILIPEGSPAFHVRYLQAKPLKVSRQYSFVVAESVDSLIVAEADFDLLTFNSMFNNSIIISVELPGLIPWGGIAIRFIGLSTVDIDYNSWLPNGNFVKKDIRISLPLKK